MIKNRIFVIKKILTIILVVSLLIGIKPFRVSGDDNAEINILYTSDIHSHFNNAGKLKTLIDTYYKENTIYLDCGDYSMGTLLQAGFCDKAYELRLLGMLNCDVTTIGNHEWDFGGYGFVKQLNSALSYKTKDDKLPKLVQSNIDLSNIVTDEQKAVKDALDKYGFCEYTIINVEGKKIAIFGLTGLESVDDTPISGMNFINYIDSAKQTVKTIKEKESPDCIICLSHSGTLNDGKTGEDFDLVDKVDGIDVVISGHSHSMYREAIEYKDSIIVSPGSDMNYLGKLAISISSKGVSLIDNEMIDINKVTTSDIEIDSIVNLFNDEIAKTYLSNYNVTADEIVCHSSFDFLSLDDMYALHQEFPMGNLIADSFIYAAEQNGVYDVDVALAPLGTIRGSFSTGNITVEDAFEICSLGMGSDGSSGHPIILAYATGKELKLLCELDASLGPMVNSIKISYAGLKMTFNEKRMPLDKITDIKLVRKDGSEEELDDEKLYCVAINVYSANMLNMVNDLTKGLLSIQLKDANGNPVNDYYSLTLKDKDGKEIKEWVAFMNYLKSFDKVNGIPQIPENVYGSPQGRKNVISEGGLSILTSPGPTTILMLGITIIFIVLLIVLISRITKRHKNKSKKNNTINE